MAVENKKTIGTKDFNQMKLSAIFSPRKVLLEPNNDLVYEWEDVFASTLDIPIIYDKKIRNNRWTKHLPFQLDVITPRINVLSIEMVTYRHNGLNKKNVIPWIVDFYLRTPTQLNNFYRNFSKNPIIYISSREAYEFLLEHGCPLNIAHLPLSLPDKYAVTPDTLFEKEYDLVLFGRQNPVLREWMFKYEGTHPDIKYISSRREGNSWCYYTNSGERIGQLAERDEYISFTRKSKAAFFSTQGMDVGPKRSNGFNQVTPRFLELLSCGCHIIARYPKNADTDFFRLEDMTVRVNSYEEFESALDRARMEPCDMVGNARYLQQHYTSNRVDAMASIIANL